MSGVKIVLASRNRFKTAEIAATLTDCGLSGLTLLSLSDIGYEGEIAETGVTFEENAAIKARVPASLGFLGMADDSGLEVDALDGRPGVYSARFAGEPCDDDANNDKLLKLLADVPDEKRTARFVSVVTFCDPERPERNFTVRGECPGVILRERRGYDGFGYDPLFYLPSLGKTYAELTTAEKNAVSHRGQAIRLFAERLKKRL